MSVHYKRTKFACYSSYFTMASVFCLPPLLFVTLQNTYGISYTSLGTLVLTNFCTQLLVDLLFSFFPKKINVRKIAPIMPLLTSLGLFIYALFPIFVPDSAYAGLLLGTVVFSVASGLSETFLSPIIAAIPSENPQRDMSLLHSLYAFGVFTVTVISTLFLWLFGNKNWAYLTMFFAVLPIIPSILFMGAPIPKLHSSTTERQPQKQKRHTAWLFLCVACIFFGSCAENAMSNWLSSYMENALHIDKAIGDVLGMASFAILLGITRICYAKFGKNILRTLFIGMLGAAICYLLIAFSPWVAPAFIACILTGAFTAMLWPGALLFMEEVVPSPGVAAYALMAAGGDLGASIAPQLMGIVIDGVSASSWAQELGAGLQLTAEQIGLKAGMLVTSLFPILGVVLLFVIMRRLKKNSKKPGMLNETAPPLT